MATSGSTSVAATSHDTLKFSWSLTSQSVANNTSTISWKLELIAGSSGYIQSSASKKWSVTVNGTNYSGTNTIGISNNATKTLASGTTTISHNSDGTKTFSYSFSQELAITWGSTYIGTKSGSGSGTLTTIPRKSTMSVANGTLGTAQTLTVTRQSTSFTHTVTYKCGSASGTIATKSTSTSISFTPPLTLAQQNTTGTSVSITYTIETFNGSTSVGSNSYTVTCSIPSSVVPTVSFTVSDGNNHLSKYGGYVQGKSTFAVAITASGSQGSTIKAYKTTADGKTYTSSSFTTSVIAGSGTLTISATVTDSRGRTATASKTVTVLAYSKPKISSFKVERCDSTGKASSSGAYLKATFSAAITSLNSKNGASYTLQYKKSSASSYTSVTLSNYDGKLSVTNGTYVFEAETSSSYNVILKASDNFTTVQTSATGSSISRLWSWLKNNKGIAFGKIAETEDLFECQFNAKFNKDVYGTVGGLGMTENIPSNSDFNNYTKIGVYSVTTNAIANTLSNRPCNYAGKLIVKTATGQSSESVLISAYAYLIQTYMDYEGRIYIRYLMTEGTANVWVYSTWKQLARINDLNSYFPLAGGRVTGNVYTDGHFMTGNKTAYGDGVIGAILSSTGNLHLQASETPKVTFFNGNTTSTPNAQIYANANGDFFVSITGNTKYFQFTSDRFRTLTNDSFYLGDSSYKWKAVYAVNGTIQTSDRNAKENIVEISDKYEALFNKLKPVTFNLKGKEHDRTHVGLIAQDVKESMDEVGLTAEDFAAYCVDNKTVFDEEKNEDVVVLDENGEPVKMYSLRYTEFIALNTHMIQKQQEKINAQQQEIDALKKELAEIKEMLKGTCSE